MTTTSDSDTTFSSSLVYGVDLSADRLVSMACDFHKDQKYGHGPYKDHLDQVWGIVKNFVRVDGLPVEEDSWLCVLSYWHDALEDHPTQVVDALVSYPDLRWLTPALELMTDVQASNRRQRKALTCKKTQERVQRMIYQLGTAGCCLSEVEWHYCRPESLQWYALTVKVADRLANMRSSKRDRPDLFKMYVREADMFELAYRTHVTPDYLTGVEDMWAEIAQLVEEAVE